MKHLLKPKNLPYAVAVMGWIGLMLRWYLYVFTVDEKNLLVSGHPLETALWILTAVVVILTVAVVWRLDGSNRYRNNFGSSRAAAIGAFVLAAGILVTTLQLGMGSGELKKVRMVLGVLAAASAVVAGIGRWQGRRPMFLFHVLMCVYFAIQNIAHYRLWSSNPQMADYVFSLLGGLTLMLFAYYQASFDVGSGSRRMQLGVGLLAVFFSLTAVGSAEEPLLYLAGAIWCFTNLCTLEPVPRRRRPGGAEETKG